jgi:peptidyl-prolyl cis-trans isomerase C
MVALAAALSWSHASRAEMDPAEKARRAAIVAKIGPRAVTLGELEDRLAEVPRFQLLTFGGDAASIRRKFLDDVIVPDVLLALGADDRKLDKDPTTAFRIARARSSATLRALREQIGTAQSIPMEDVKAYYEKNRSLYDAPERIHVWRVLCKSREEALTVLEAARRDATVSNFNALARDHSIDKATYLRGGNLGFLSPDGTSNEPGVKVEADIVKAAQRVKDGEIVPEPVAEGPNWAVVWRRGTVGASRRTVEDAAAQIRDSIHRERVERATQKLMADLRARDVKDVNEELLKLVEISPGDGTISATRRPGTVAPIDQKKK